MNPPCENEDWRFTPTTAGDTDDWTARSPAFSGDFYREQDTVCRGVTISPQDVPGLGSYKDGMIDGDFYRDPDDVHKGLSLGGSAFEPSSFSKELEFSSLSYANSLNFKEDASQVYFKEADVPPPAPTDPFFKFEVTTMFAETTAKPFQIGNDLREFLTGKELCAGENYVTAALTKVRTQKFSFKADVFDNSMMCTLKIRVYSQGPNQYAIEFQRRIGDTISFNNTYQKAFEHLSRKPYMTLRRNEVLPMPFAFAPPPLPADFIVETISEADLEPLLDMASLVGSPWLQAEAAGTLSKMASEGKAAVRSSRVFEAIGDLLQTDSTEVALPTACLISNLAKQSEAYPLLNASGLLPRIQDKVDSPQTNSQVRQRLAEALQEASYNQMLLR